MMKPTVHMNGTSAAELFKQLTDARSAIRIASDKVAAAWPNGRDYLHARTGSDRNGAGGVA